MQTNFRKRKSEVIISIRFEEFVTGSGKGDIFEAEVISERFLGSYQELTCRLQNTSHNTLDIILHAYPGSRYDKKCRFSPIGKYVKVR